MIERLRLSNIGVIVDAEVELGPGFVAVTGETGAGKTMIMTGIAALTGAKLDASVIRSGTQSAVVEGEFSHPGEIVLSRIQDAGGVVDDELALFSRSLVRTGRGRAVVGGRTVPIAVLTELAESLVAVHGQRDQARLLQESQQREALDEYSGSANLVAEYRGAYLSWRELADTLADLEATATSDGHELALLQAGIAEIDSVDPQPEEDEKLAAQLDRLGNAAELAEYAQRALFALRDEATESLRLAEQALQRASVHDPSVQDLVIRTDEVVVLAESLARDLDAYATELDADPSTIDALESRRAALNALKRKFGPSLAEVHQWYERAQRRVLALDTSPERIAALREAVDAARTQLQRCGEALHERRRRGAHAFAAAVTAELVALAMPNARIEVNVEPLSEPASHGMDRVRILMATHEGDTPRPIGKGASGGELSRIMLAVEVVLGSHHPVPTFVFDEVDAGVGGRAAVEVGKRLAALARHAQVIVVTHLPQVAAFADTHIVVTKATDGQVNEANVGAVTGGARIAELARMMAGQDGSATGAAHASELLESADALKREMSAE